MKKTRLPFSFDCYQKGGYEVETVKGYKVRIALTDVKGFKPILASVLTEDGETAYYYGSDGKYNLYDASYENDLCLVEIEYEEGDIVYTNNGLVDCISIFKEYDKEDQRNFYYYAEIYNNDYGKDYGKDELSINGYGDAGHIRMATEEEKKRIFNRIQEDNIKIISRDKTMEWPPKSEHLLGKTNELTVETELTQGMAVLTKNRIENKWEFNIYGRYDEEIGRHVCVGYGCVYCIPLNSETEHLLGKCEDCPDKYKTWLK